MTLAAPPILPTGKPDLSSLPPTGGLGSVPDGTSGAPEVAFQLLLLAQAPLFAPILSEDPDGIIAEAASTGDGSTSSTTPVIGDLGTPAQLDTKTTDPLVAETGLVSYAPLFVAEITDPATDAVPVATDGVLTAPSTNLSLSSSALSVLEDTVVPTAPHPAEVIPSLYASEDPLASKQTVALAGSSDLPALSEATVFSLVSFRPSTGVTLSVDTAQPASQDSRPTIPADPTTNVEFSLPIVSVDSAVDGKPSLPGSPETAATTSDNVLSIASRQALSEVFARTANDTTVEMTVTAGSESQAGRSVLTALVPADGPEPIIELPPIGQVAASGPQVAQTQEAAEMPIARVAVMEMAGESAPAPIVTAVVPEEWTERNTPSGPRIAETESPSGTPPDSTQRVNGNDNSQHNTRVGPLAFRKVATGAVTESGDVAQPGPVVDQRPHPAHQPAAPTGREQEHVIPSETVQQTGASTVATGTVVDVAAPSRTQASPLSAGQIPVTEGDASSATTPTRFIVDTTSRQALAGHITVRLEPPELGVIRIDLTSGLEGVVGRLRIHSEATRAAVERDITQLHQTLADAGVRVDRLEVASVSRTVDAVWARSDDVLSRLASDRTPLGRSLTQEHPGENPWRQDRQRRHRGAPYDEQSSWARWMPQYAAGLNVVA
ncbi:MAG: flagellar hook-length control protein FliK [Candidatus Zixiibacteriota bacterium]